MNQPIQKIAHATLVLIASCLLAVHALAQTPAPGRPPIAAIDHVSLYAQDLARSEAFYVSTLHAKKVVDAAHPGAVRFYFNSQQYVEILPLPASSGDTRLAAVGFGTADAAALRGYLAARHQSAVEPLSREVKGEVSFRIRDPEDNAIVFTQVLNPVTPECFSDVSCHIIHAGFLVHDRAAEDRFYLDILGFRPYWQGAMTPGKVDWVSQQVPEGPEWLEYMMTGPGSDHPLAGVDRAELGGMNHISLAVANMEATVTDLLGQHRLTGRYNGPQMGRDGKWQTNLYDPDGTRIELMEPEPSIEPCCSAYKAVHPGLRPPLSPPLR